MDRRNSAVNDIYAQRLDASGVAQWQANGDTVSWGTGDSFQPDLVPVGPGEVIVGIDADQGGAERRNIIVHRFPPPATTDVPGAAGGVELALASAPNPTVRRATLTLALSHPARVSLSLFDAAGRRVRRLHDGVLPTGKHVFHWDGTGEDGSRSPAGVYFARLAGEGRNRTTRVVVLGH